MRITIIGPILETILFFRGGGKLTLLPTRVSRGVSLPPPWLFPYRLKKEECNDSKKRDMA